MKGYPQQRIRHQYMMFWCTFPEVFKRSECLRYFNLHRSKGIDLDAALVEGSLLRLQPVLITTLTTVLGLLPLLISTGMGSEVQRPLATVVVFGLSTSTLLTLFVIPAMYGWIEERLDPSLKP